MRTNRILAGVLGVLGLGLAQPFTGSDDQAALFEGKNTLRRPVGYREWIFVGSSMGLRYAKSPDENRVDPKRDSASEVYHNVYINPSSYQAFAKTGEFPEGTVMILELANSHIKSEPGLQGSFQKEFVGLEASVKDSRRFKEVWAYFSFDGSDGKRKDKAQPFEKEACWTCHRDKAETDHVFTQFYPVLREIKPKVK